MAFWGNFMTRLIAGYQAFQKPQLITDPLRLVQDRFGYFDARRLRYAIYWGFYENTAYDTVHTWAQSYKTQYGLYRYIRNIYNPTYRLGEFWKSHLWGGPLDPLAGDGKQTPSALPIITKIEQLRPAISQVWKWSNWQIGKDIISLYGGILGDVGIQIVDDPLHKKVYLRPIHPGTVADVELDAYGNVKSYCLQEERRDPRPNLEPKKIGAFYNPVVYTEEATRDGNDVAYRTYLNGDLYPWNGVAAEWQMPYGFTPMVMIQHNNVGLDWGWSELHSGRSKFHEADDLASKLSDQIRKMVDAPALISGMSKPQSTPTTSKTQLSGQAAADRPQPGREELPIVWAQAVGVTYTSMIAPLDIAAAGARIDSILSEIEREYPELQMDIWNSSGDKSGRALRIARQRTETKVGQRRVSYDDALTRALQMAIAIGGDRGYEGFGGLSLDSYAGGGLDFAIGDRPVFRKDPLDDLEVDNAFWTAAGLAIKAGIPLPVYLKRAGWSEADIEELKNDPDWQSKAEMQAMALQMQRTVAGGGDGGGQGAGGQGSGGASA